MARRSKAQIRETYNKKLGEDLIAKLSDEQIALISKTYNSLDDKETSDVDSRIIMGYNDTILHEMARDMIGEEEEGEEDIPEGLDDLLGSIQDEPVEAPPEAKVTTIKASAIVPSKFFGEDKYAKYRDELISEGTIEGEQLTSEERKEGFKTRNDSDKFGTFIENFLNRKKKSDEQETKSFEEGGALVVPNQQKINVDPLEEEKDNNIDDILKGINSILEIIKKDQDFDKKKANKERKKEEKEKRSVRENKLEKKDSVLMKAAKSIVAPVKSIFDKIIEYFTTIFLGRALFKLIEWFGDPDNKTKINNIIKFLGDFWPTLLAGYLLFGTKLGGFITTITGLLIKFTPKILALLKNPIVAGTVATGLGIYGIGKMLGKDKVVENETVRADTSRQELEVAPSTKDMSAGDREALVQGTRLKDAGGGGTLNNMPNQFVDPLGLRQDPTGLGGIDMQAFNGGGKVTQLQLQQFNGGGVVEKKDKNSFNIFNPMSWFSGDAQKATEGKLDNVSNNTLAGKLYNKRKQQEEMMKKLRGYEEGGRVKGESGIDKVPAMLTNGEFVMSTGAVQKYGLDTMMTMNAAGGGTNKPKIMQGTMYAQGGGAVGPVTFNPGEYRKGMQTTRHIENPGNSGKSYVVGYDRSPEGNVVVKQINKVVTKAGPLGHMIRQSDKLTGISPGSDEWNMVLGSENTKKELSVKQKTDKRRRASASKLVPPKSITTHPEAKTFHEYNQKFQIEKNKAISEGKDEKEAEFEAAQAATQLPGLNVAGNTGGGNANAEPGGIVGFLMNAIKSMAGVGGGGSSEDGGDGEMTARKESQSTPPGAKNPGVYPKQGKTLYLHWTAGGYNSVVGPYHTVFTGDGKKHRLVDYDRTSGHTYNRNSNSIGLSVAAMGGGSNETNMAQAPTEAQLDAMATEAATIGKSMGWTAGDINIRNVMTHGEAGSNLDGRNAHENYGPSAWGGTGERWDLDKLRKGQKIGEGGSEMRSRIAAKLGTVSAPVKAQTGGQIELGKSKPMIPEITPLQKSKPKVTMIDGGTNVNAPKRSPVSTKLPEFSASTASREKANLLGIIDY